MSTTISEAQRFEMHSKLRNLMGDEVANTLMEHLPPSGWADVARKSDVDRLEADIARVEVALRYDIERLEVAMKADVDRLEIDIARVEKSLRTDIERLNNKIDRVESSLKEDIHGLRTAMWAMASLMTTGFVGLFALIATKL